MALSPMRKRSPASTASIVSSVVSTLSREMIEVRGALVGSVSALRLGQYRRARVLESSTFRWSEGALWGLWHARSIEKLVPFLAGSGGALRCSFVSRDAVLMAVSFRPISWTCLDSLPYLF